MEEPITVRIATLKVVSNPKVLICRGLGSCVGVALWDRETGIGGLAHILLPNERFSIKKDNPGKFANQAIELMVRKMTKLGASKKRIVAKIAGGARMFSTPMKRERKKRQHVGERNVIAVKEKLVEMGVPISAEDTGGNRGRSMEFDTKTGKVVIYHVDQTKRVL